jgi:hypothetical protein
MVHTGQVAYLDLEIVQQFVNQDILVGVGGPNSTG